MPELPEVEAYRRDVVANGLGRKIVCVDLRLPDMLEDGSARNLESALRGREFADVRRHGKILFLRAGDGPWVVLRFGMTGALVFRGAGEKLPEHARLVITFADGGRLCFDNQRKLGRIGLTDDIGRYLTGNAVGPDALSLDRDAFAGIVGGTRGAVKPALMDQSKLTGLGNVYSDEVLFRAGIDPGTKGNALPEDALSALHAAMICVLETAADRLAQGRDLPDDWLASHRRAGETCPRCGTGLVARKISGRRAWVCPACQDRGAPG